MDIKTMQKKLREACHSHHPYCYSNGKCPMYGVMDCSIVICGDDYQATLKAYDIMFREDRKMVEPKIIIMQDKDDRTKVVAKRFDTGETAFAKCAPEDTFDFMVGAKLALERLGKPRKPKFKIGDRVVANAKAKGRYTITVPGWRGTVVKVRDDEIEVKGSGPLGIRVYPVSAACFDIDTSPAYYTGEVVCVRAGGYDFWTVGKVYAINNGVIKDDDGDKRGNFESIDHLNRSMNRFDVEFIEFKGK